MSGLNFTIIYSPSDFSAISVAADSSANQSGKLVDCNSSAPGQYSCMVYGMNANPIPDGVVAQVTLNVIANTLSSSSAVSLSSLAATTPDGSALTATGTGAAITIPQPVAQLSTLACNPSTLTAPASSTCTVSLTGNAPSGGLAITTTSSGVAVTMPSSVKVTAGSSSATFTVQVASGSGTATITATSAGVSKSASLTISQPPSPQLSALACTPTALTAPASSTCTVSLTANAPSGGLAVATTGSGVAVTIPSSVTVASGSSSASFVVQVSSGSGTATITATLAGISKSVNLTISAPPPPVTVTVTPGSVSLGPSKTAQFTATVSGTTSTAVTWSLSPATGAISSSGLYTAPVTISAASTVTVKATGSTGVSATSTVSLVPPPPPVVNPPVISTVVASPATSTAVITWTTSTASDSTVAYGTSASSLSNSATNSALVTSHSLTLTGLLPGTTYYFTVTSKDSSGNSASSAVASFQTPFASNSALAISLLPSGVLPVDVQDPDASPVELGVKFYSDVPGTVSAIRFYKGSANNGGTHTGALWTAAGTRLASVTFTGESSTGWQTGVLSSPVAIAANTPYVVSYFSPQSHYSATSNYFSAPANNGVLHSAAGANGLYTYGSSSAFPTSTYQASNYFVDLLFTPTASAAYPASITATTGTAKSGGATQLATDDNQYLQINSASVSGVNTTDWYATFNAIPRTALSLAIGLDDKNSRSCSEVVSIWNWTSSAWVQLDARSVGNTKTMRPALVPSGAPGNYISGTSTTGSVRVRVQCSTKSGSFTASTDLLNLAYTQ